MPVKWVSQCWQKVHRLLADLSQAEACAEWVVDFAPPDQCSEQGYAVLPEDVAAMESAVTLSARGSKVRFESAFPDRRFQTNLSALTVSCFRNVRFRVAPVKIADTPFPAVIENRVKLRRLRYPRSSQREIMPVLPYDEGNWAHCLQDVLPILAVLRSYLRERPNIVIMIIRPDFDVGVLLRAMGIPNPVMFFESGTYACAKLHRVSFAPNATVYFWPPRLFRAFAACLQIDPRPEKYLIHISRSDVATRRVRNESELERLLREKARQRGIEYLKFNPARQPLTDSMALFRSAAVIVAPHGGANYHAVFSRAETLFIEFCMTRELHCLANVALSLNLNYWLVPIDADKYCPDFDAPLAKVAKIIDAEMVAAGPGRSHQEGCPE